MILKSNNYALVAGYVPRDAEVRTTPNGHNVCNFSVKASEVPDESGNNVVIWMNCVAWNKACDVARYFRKGDSVLVAGKVTQRSYTTQNGDERTVTELTCDFAVAMQLPQQVAPMFQAAASAAPPAAASFEELGEISDDDLPF